jgi:hypothetical protein
MGVYPDRVLNGGTFDIAGWFAQLALVDATTSYTMPAGLPFAYDYAGIALGSARFSTLTPRVYHLYSPAQSTDDLIFSHTRAEDFGNDRSDLKSDGSSRGSTLPIPEPATMLLFGSGLAGVAASRKQSTRALMRSKHFPAHGVTSGTTLATVGGSSGARTDG